MNTDNGALSFDAYINNSDFKRQIDEMNARIKGLSDSTVKETKKMDDAFSGVGKAMLALGGTAVLTGFARQLINVRGEFQKLDVAFTTMLGSKEKATALMGQIVETAAKTPFTLQEVAAGAKQLLAYQVAADKVNETVIRLGNISAGVGVPLGQLVAVYGQVKAKGRLMGDDMRQFMNAGIPIVSELAKVMGVADSEIQQLVTDGKVGFTEVNKVIENLTNQGGMFFNLMEAQSKTLSGQISNLQDAWDRMLNKIGQGNEGLLSGLISGATYAVDHYEEILDIITPLIAAYGAYKVAIMTTAAAQTIATKYGVYDIATKELQIGATIKATIAQNGLNTAMKANPVAFALAAIAGLSVVIYKLASDLSESEKAQKRLNDAMDSANDKIAQEKNSVDGLLAIINNENISRDVRNQKMKELIALSPELLNGLTLENIKTEEGTKLLESYLKVREKQIRMDSLKAELDDSIRRKQEAQAGKENVGFLDKAKAGLLSLGGGPSSLAAYGTSIAMSNLKNNMEVIAAEEELQKQIISKMEALSSESSTVVEESKKTIEEQIKEIRAKIQEAKGKLSDMRLLSSVATPEDIDSQEKLIKDLEKQLELLTGTKKAKEKSETKQLEDELNQRKAMYEAYYSYIELFGEEAARKQFATLLKDGESYTAYLEKKQNDLKNLVSGGGASDEQLKNLQMLTEELNDVKGIKDSYALFNEELERINQSAKTTSEYLKKLAELRAKVLSGGSGLNPEQRTMAIQSIDDKSATESRQAYDNLLKDYKDFAAQKAEIEAQFQSDIEVAQKNGNKRLADDLQKELKKRLSTLGLEAIMKSDMLADVYGDLDELTVKEIDKLIAEIDKKKVSLGVEFTDADQEKLKKILKDLRNEIASRNPFTALSQALKDVKENASSDNMQKLIDAGSSLASNFQDISDNVISMVEQLGGVFSEDAKAFLDDFFGNLQAAQKGAEAWGGWWGAIIGGVSDLLPKLVKWLGKDRKKEKSIQESIIEVSKLERAYEELQRAIDDAFGTDAYKLQQESLENLKKQKEEYEDMVEKEKDKKKTDKNKVEEYKNAIASIEAQMSDMVESMKENLLNSDAKTVAKELGDAIVEAFMAGEDAAKAWGDKVKDIVGDVIKNIIVQNLIEKRVGTVINSYMDKWIGQDGSLLLSTDAIMQSAVAMGNELTSLGSSISAILENLPADVKEYLTGGDENKSPLQGAISGASEETVSILSGYINAVRIQQLESIEVMKTQLAALNQISNNTNNLVKLNDILSVLKAMSSGSSTRAYGL